jgi:hypothetical protein
VPRALGRVWVCRGVQCNPFSQRRSWQAVGGVGVAIKRWQKGCGQPPTTRANPGQRPAPVAQGSRCAPQIHRAASFSRGVCRGVQCNPSGGEHYATRADKLTKWSGAGTSPPVLSACAGDHFATARKVAQWCGQPQPTRANRADMWQNARAGAVCVGGCNAAHPGGRALGQCVCVGGCNAIHVWWAGEGCRGVQGKCLPNQPLGLATARRWFSS